jgi:predicted transcriptional regulator
MTDKQCVIEMLQGLPEDASIEDIRYETISLLQILEGQRDIAAGRTHSHEDVMEMAKQCISKYVGQRQPASI